MSQRVLITPNAEAELYSLGFTAVQRQHALEIAFRLKDFDDKIEIGDLDIELMGHFYEVRRLLEAGGPLIKRELQLKFGVVERDDGDIVILQVTDNHENPDSIELIMLEDRYRFYLANGLASVLVDKAV